jgi:hypothetical protein
MSLNFEVTKKNIGEISINFDELKAELESALTKYKGILVTKETIPLAKKDRANLNKVADMINDRKKELKKEILEPYTIIENQIKELLSMISEVTSSIDSQIKEFDEQDKKEKHIKIIESWETFGFNLVPLERIFNEKWYNKTYSLVNIVNEMQEFITTTKNELAVIEEMFNGNKLEAQTKYLQTLDLYKTIADLKQEEAIRKKLTQKIVSEPQEETQEEVKYVLQFEIYTTEQKIKALSQFLKENNIEYRRIDKEN